MSNNQAYSGTRWAVAACKIKIGARVFLFCNLHVTTVYLHVGSAEPDQLIRLQVGAMQYNVNSVQLLI